ncbi:MAG: RDD family protein [Gammaproteobacteria bacterium]
MPGNVLDTVVTAETPEGILLELRPAGLSARFFAFLIDWLIRLAAIYAVALAVGFAGMNGIAAAVIAIFAFALEWFYPVAFELSRTGSSPGKRVFGLRVVMDNGLPVTPGASLTRNLLRFADFLPFFFGFAIVSMPAAERLQAPRRHRRRDAGHPRFARGAEDRVESGRAHRARASAQSCGSIRRHRARRACAHSDGRAAR